MFRPELSRALLLAADVQASIAMLAPHVEGREHDSTGTLRMKLRMIFLLSGILLAIAAGSESRAKEKVSVALNVDPSHFAMTYALRTGKVTSDVVDIDLHFLDINALTQAASTKRFDILQLSALAVPRAITQGLAMKILGNTASVPGGPGRDIWVKKDSPLQKPEDLKGKSLGVYSLATGAVTLVRVALWKRYGMNVAVNGGDFQMKQLQIAAMPAALATGQVDASMLSNIQAYRAGKSGDFRSIMSSDRITIELFGANPVSAVFIGYPERLEARREAYRAALQLLLASRNYSRSHPDEVFKAVGAEQNVDPEYLRIWEDQYQGYPIALSDGDIPALDKLWELSKQLGILNETVVAKDIIWDAAPRR
jgi:NitT/TauT family transport system substrate-binding protein